MLKRVLSDERIHVLHVLHSFDTGGIENGVVNLVNRLPPERTRHTVMALTHIADGFRQRVQRPDVEFIALNKPPGHAVGMYPTLLKLFKELKPDIAHTRNLGALECQMVAMWAGIPVRIHGEHGRDIDDLDGSNRRHRLIRRLYRPFVHHYVALSNELNRYLQQGVGIKVEKISEICNGVDLDCFSPAPGARASLAGSPFSDAKLFVVGTVGRMQDVKNQVGLARAFVRVLEAEPRMRERLRLVMVGEGPQRGQAQALLDAAGCSDLVWLPGERADVADVMRGMDCFVLPSLAEGISNTILEAMASGLPVIATRVGGNSELVEDGITGEIVEADDVEELADRISRMVGEPARYGAMGRAARQRAQAGYGLPTMVRKYLELYERLHALRARPR